METGEIYLWAGIKDGCKGKVMRKLDAFRQDLVLSGLIDGSATAHGFHKDPEPVDSWEGEW